MRQNILIETAALAAPPPLAPAAGLGSRSAELENFIAFAAHDLRAPFAQMESLLDLIKEDFVDMGDGKLALLHHLN